MPIYTAQLEDSLFSSKEPNKLYFYCFDIRNGVRIKQENEKKVVQVFNTLHDKAQRKGMSFILMVAVDKYDLYQKYIVNNSFPTKTINEDIEHILGKNPHLFLAKQYLLPMVERGEKDIFRFTDTHWSYKASEALAEELYKRICGEEITHERDPL